MMTVRAVLFDVDGTLLDSNGAQTLAWLDVLGGHGHDVSYEHVRARLGVGSRRLLQELTPIDAQSAEGRALLDRRRALLFEHYLPDLGPLPGARALVDRVRARGISCVAVAEDGREARALLEAAGLADILPIFACDGAELDPIELVLDHLRVSTQEALLVGDSPSDIARGRQANVAVIALRSGGYSDEELTGALALYDGPLDLATKLEGSPIFSHDRETRAPLSASR